MISKFLNRLLTPEETPPKVVLIASILMMTLLFAADILTPADIRIHVLYVFPLAALGLHCKEYMALLGLALSVAFQLATFILQAIPNGPLVTDTLVAFASAVLTLILARTARAHHFRILRLATTDSLTDLQNRRGFEFTAKSEIARQKRYGGVFSLAIIDLDNFKALNDSKGHIAGDTALKLAADVIRKHIRHSDFCARLGGDEFAVLMPNTRKVDCSLVCQNLAAMISKRMAEAGIKLTASIGFTTFEYAPKSIWDALQKADEAMYAAKAAGKSCAVGI